MRRQDVPVAGGGGAAVPALQGGAGRRPRGAGQQGEGRAHPHAHEVHRVAHPAGPRALRAVVRAAPRQQAQAGFVIPLFVYILYNTQLSTGLKPGMQHLM